MYHWYKVRYRTRACFSFQRQPLVPGTSNASKIYVTDLISKSVFHNIIITAVAPYIPTNITAYINVHIYMYIFICVRLCARTGVSLLFFNNKLLLLYVCVRARKRGKHLTSESPRGPDGGAGRDGFFKIMSTVLFVHYLYTVRFLSRRRPVVRLLRRHNA